VTPDGVHEVHQPAKFQAPPITCAGAPGGAFVSGDKVVPFRPRPPSEAELAVYKAITRNWHPELRQRILPDHFRSAGQEAEVAAKGAETWTP
jgi:hypothetical protein